MAILETNNNYTGSKSLVFTAYTTAFRLAKSNRFWAIAQEQSTPESFNTTENLAIRVFVDTVLTSVTPPDLINVYAILEDANSDWDDLNIPSVNATNIGASLSAQQKSDLILLLAGTATLFLTELNNEISTLLG